MHKKIIESLVDLQVFDLKIISAKDFDLQKQENTSADTIYLHEDTDYYGDKIIKQIDTKGLSNEEIKLLLDIDRTKNIRSIKNMIIFFVVLAVISIIISIWSGISLASLF